MPALGRQLEWAQLAQSKRQLNTEMPPSIQLQFHDPGWKPGTEGMRPKPVCLPESASPASLLEAYIKARTNTR